ncbi:MAG: cupin domain-containing protein [bacterium]
MMLRHSHEVPEEKPSLQGTKGCILRWLIAEKDGAEHYAMRLFELKPGGLIPLHSHVDSEHEIYIIEGTGTLDNSKNKITVKKGDVIFVKPGDKHSFTNSSDKPFKFICVIPII